MVCGTFTTAAYSEESTIAPIAKSTETKKFSSAEKHYSIEHPAHWESKEMAKLDLVLFAPGKDGSSDPVASMNIVSEKVDETVTLDQFYNESLTNLKTALKDVNIVKSGDKSLNGTPSKWIAYTHEMQGVKFAVLQYFIVANDMVYLITFSSPENLYESFSADFEKVAESFNATQKA